MRSRRFNQRGVSLLEVMVSMAIFTIGLLGVIRMHVMAAGSDGYAQHVDRATAVAQDLLGYLQQVDHDHPLLTNTSTANDKDLLDEGHLFEATTLGSTAYDHVDSELPTERNCVTVGSVNACAPPFAGLATAPADTSDLSPTLTFGGDAGEPAEFDRYWIIGDAQTAGALGEPTRPVKAIAVVVRWRDAATSRFKRVVAFGTAYDPSLVTSP